MSGRRLRVVHVTATFPPYVGGTGNVAYYNARELQRRGHDVTVVTAVRGASEPDQIEGIPVVRLPSTFRIGNAPFTPALPAALRGAELVHLHYPYYFGAEMVWWWCQRSRVPYVVTYHQDVIFSGPLNYAGRAHHAMLGQRILKGAARVGATSLDYAQHSHLVGLPQDLVVEIPNGVDLDRFRPTNDTDYQPPSLPSERGRQLLFVGGLDRAHYFKGLPVLLAAIVRLPEALLVIVGEGDLRADYERMSVKLGPGVRVTFAGRVTDADLPGFYRRASVTILPSVTRGEAFGLVLVESMACGTPVVASRLPGVRSVVEDGVDGLLAEPGSSEDLAAKIATLLADPAQAAAMGAAGRRKVEARYDWRRIGERLERLYLEVLDG